MRITAITKEQWVKVLKALAYAFVSAFVVAIAASQDFSQAGLLAAATAGFNAVLVAIKQLFTEA